MVKINPLHRVLEPYHGIYNLAVTHQIVLPQARNAPCDFHELYEVYEDYHLNWEYDGDGDLSKVNYHGIPVVFRVGIDDVLVEPRIPDNPLPFDVLDRVDISQKNDIVNSEINSNLTCNKH